MSLNATPRLACGDVVDSRRPHAVFACDSADEFTVSEPCANLRDVCCGELATMHSLAVDTATAFVHVAEIVALSAENEVLRVDAQRDVAGMANDHAFRHFPLARNLPGGDVGGHLPAFGSGNDAVATPAVADATMPEQAPSRARRTFPGKPVGERRSGGELESPAERVTVLSFPATVVSAILESALARKVAPVYFAFLSVHALMIQHRLHHERMVS